MKLDTSEVTALPTLASLQFEGLNKKQFLPSTNYDMNLPTIVLTVMYSRVILILEILDYQKLIKPLKDTYHWFQNDSRSKSEILPAVLRFA